MRPQSRLAQRSRAEPPASSFLSSARLPSSFIVVSYWDDAAVGTVAQRRGLGVAQVCEARAARVVVEEEPLVVADLDNRVVVRPSSHGVAQHALVGVGPVNARRGRVHDAVRVARRPREVVDPPAAVDPRPLEVPPRVVRREQRCARRVDDAHLKELSSACREPLVCALRPCVPHGGDHLTGRVRKAEQVVGEPREPR